MPQRQAAIDPLADTQTFSLAALADTQRITRPVLDDDDVTADRWFAEGEQQAEREWRQLATAADACCRLPFAIALAGTAVVASLIAMS